MSAVLRIVRLGHAARNTHSLKTRQPLAAVTLVTANEALPGLVTPYADLLKDELNVRDIRWAADRSDYVHHEVRPVFPKTGPRFGKRMPEVKKALESADGDALAAELETAGKITIEISDGPRRPVARGGRGPPRRARGHGHPGGPRAAGRPGHRASRPS